MILVILGICILLAVGIFIVWRKCDDERDYEFLAFLNAVPIVCVIVALVITGVLGVKVANLRVIDEKIAMYQEENTKIEQQIDAAVKSYQNYESHIITECAPESSITLVSLYPELQADTLVQKQIEVYIQNNKKIKDLKERDINGDVYRWWLYFGGNK